jgi:cysteinyl-tRNA synthetase
VDKGALVTGADSFRPGFDAAMDDDFNTAVGLAALGDAAAMTNKLLDDPKAAAKDVRRRTLASLRGQLLEMGAELGLLTRPPEAYLLSRRARIAAARNVDEAEIDRLLVERNAARKAKDFARADALRGEVAARGIEVMDTPGGTRWRFGI